jgi:hypothetical protein
MLIVSIAIAVFLALLAGLLLWAGHRLWHMMMQSAGRLAEAQPQVRDLPATPRPVRADALVYLFGNEFARPPKPGRSAGPRLAAIAPLTDQELDAREWASKMLFALLAEEHEEGTLEFRVVPHTPSMMPPFPYKNWELEVRRVEPLTPSPLADCLGVAFDMVEKRAQRSEPEATADEDELHWHPLDFLLEKMLVVVRAETSFWEREGVYGDLRNYIIDTLVAEGYLVEKGGNTWIDHLRRRRIEPNREAIEELAPAAEALLRRLHGIRQRNGSALWTVGEEPEISYTHLNTPASLTSLDDPEQGMLWADALGISLYEALVALRQLEPTNEGGA